MLLSEWVVWSSIETVKYFLVIYGILGFQVKKTRIKYIVFFYYWAFRLLIIITGILFFLKQPGSLFLQNLFLTIQ